MNSKKLIIFDLDNTLYLSQISSSVREQYEIHLKDFLICQNKTLSVVTYNTSPHRLLEVYGDT
jgi:FMN phosphatase YigB (HAD superfamily)